MKYKTHSCDELSLNNIGEAVVLSGWVHRFRDHGGLVFIDLRDPYGITQVVFRGGDFELENIFKTVRSEFVIRIEGVVEKRMEGMTNPTLKTGEIEVNIKSCKILSSSKVPPFSICDEINVNEDIRLQYRYLDIRRGKIKKNLIERHKAVLKCRKFFDEKGFIEIVTPILGKSTPEGARDYLVPSRIYPGKFYALPQSPQIFKQLLMISGISKYFQLALCFRDEDLRADRQPEFSQIDLEMSFSDREELFTLVEELMVLLFKEHYNIDFPIPRISYKEALDKYGTDKPDIRFSLELKNCNEIASQFSFSIFLDQISNGGIVKGFNVEKGASISRKKIEEYTDFVKKYGAQGLVWIKKLNGDISSNVSKFASKEVMNQLLTNLEVEENDISFIVAAPEKIANQSLDNLRRLIARERQLYNENAFGLLWVTDFPLFSLEEGRLVSEHHPFTSPIESDIALLDTDPLKVRSSSYDLVLNGYEIASGSQRIYDNLLQEKIFNLLGLTDKDIKEKFGFFVEALKYGTPPHLGIALGLDRLIMILAKTNNIRDIIAFPKTQKAADVMMRSPAEVLQNQLKELNINLRDL